MPCILNTFYAGHYLSFAKVQSDSLSVETDANSYLGERFILLKDNEKRNPEQWTGHLAFGEYYLKENNQKLATEYFKKAFEHAPENWKNYTRYLYLQNKFVLERG